VNAVCPTIPDRHSDLNRELKKNCDINDQPTAALLKDLKQRGKIEPVFELQLMMIPS